MALIQTANSGLVVLKIAKTKNVYTAVVSDVTEHSLQDIVQIKDCLASIIDIMRSRDYDAQINADPDKHLPASYGKNYISLGYVHVSGIAKQIDISTFRKQINL